MITLHGTITLQDIGIIMGLRVDRNVVTHVLPASHNWRVKIEHLLGRLSEKMDRNDILLTWLRSHMMHQFVPHQHIFDNVQRVKSIER